MKESRLSAATLYVYNENKEDIRERLEEAKKECGECKPPDKAHQKKPPEHDL